MTKPSAEVVEAVAAEKRTEPNELEAMLFEAIDPHALDTLFDGRSTAEGFVQFAFADCRVVVTDSGDVTVASAAED